MRRLILAGLMGLAAPALAGAAFAEPAVYVLEPDRSRVAFETDFGPDTITGTMPVARADLTLDFDAPGNSVIRVDLDVAGAQASFPFAAQALRGPKVLDAAQFPRMTFASTALRATGDAATVTGDLTLRGVTRPLTLRAEIFRQQGSAPGDLRHLTIRLTGTINRSEYGATGWADMVADEVRIVITARIARKD